MNNLSSLLSFDNIIIRSETWLLNRLLEWYRFKNSNSDNDNYEFKCEFKYLIQDHIDKDLINEDEIKYELKGYMDDLNIVLKRNKLIKYVDLYTIKDNNIQDFIINNYNENEKIKFNTEDRIILDKIKKDDLNDIIMSLLSVNDEVVTEIMLMIMTYKNLHIESIYIYIFEMIIIIFCQIEFLTNIDKRNVLSVLCCKYNEYKYSRTLKCLSLFINDKKMIVTIENLCGKEVLFKLIDSEDYAFTIPKELLIRYIKEVRLSESEKEEMKKIVRDKVLLEDLLDNRITMFKYIPQQNSISVHQEVNIVPLFEGDRCSFSIKPDLPVGLLFDKRSGIINGRVDKPVKNQVYEVTCQNLRNEKKFKISLEIVETQFTALNKSEELILSNNRKLVTQTKDWHFNHCYLNIKMEKGIFYFKYKFHQNQADYNNRIMFGLSTDNTFSDDRIFTQPSTCNIDITNTETNMNYCNIGNVVNKKPNIVNHGDGSIYEVAVDMNRRTFWISHNNSSPVLLVNNLPSPLYPYVELVFNRCSIELLSVVYNDDGANNKKS